MSHAERATEDRRPGPIPYTLSRYLCIEFVNSRFEDHTGTGEAYDRLEMPRWRAWFADRAGIAVTDPPTPEAFRELVQVRAFLRRLLEARVQPDANAVSWINRYLAASRPVWQLGRADAGYQLQMTWGTDWSAVIAAVLVSYGQLLESGHVDRVRRCANPHCTWLFYDESRNASRRWCDPRVCGNLHGVRAHRERSRRQAQPRTGS